MQEDIENKTLMLMVNSGKFTGRTLRAAVTAFLASRKNAKMQKKAKNITPRGKQSVKKLVRQNEGVASMDMSGQMDKGDPDIRQFDRIARKYGVDYAIQKDKSTSPPKFMLFFKARDSGAITAAFQEYSAKKVQRESRPSVRKRLEKVSEVAEDVSFKAYKLHRKLTKKQRLRQKERTRTQREKARAQRGEPSR